MVPDQKLIEGCIEGKRKAFALLYRRYAAGMLGVCLRYCRNRAEAEDVLQEGFIKVFGNIGNFRKEGSLEGWIRRIVVNTAIDHYNKMNREGYPVNIEDINETDLGEEPEQPDEDTLFREDFSEDDLLAVIQQLPNGYRVVFNMYAVEGFSHQEIADTLNISVNTSKTQLFKARRWLRKSLAGLLQQQVNNR
jgi:RNA polymerase sigma factor (sigma-70 family)